MQPYPLAKLFWEKLVSPGQVWLDLGKIKILHPKKHSIPYGYGYYQNVNPSILISGFIYSKRTNG